LIVFALFEGFMTTVKGEVLMTFYIFFF
jgi:hypothetical protein